MKFTYNSLGNNGRMGNQLFQCAATIGTSLNHNCDYYFPEDWKYKKFFNIPDDKFYYECPKSQYSEPYFHFSQIPAGPPNHSIDLVGYFQSPKYWQDYEAVVKDLLTPKNIGNVQYGKTGIHVRRGDYVNLQDCHPLQSLEYYHQAIQLIPSNKYVIFSDDIAWCKKSFIGPEFEFAENNSEIQDFIQLAEMENFIIANSSFSWWAAYLGQNLNKKIIAPKNWFGPKLNHDTKDLIPDNWIRL